jgi:hypothetical protein
MNMKVSLLFYQSAGDFADRDDPARRAAYWSDRLPYYNAIRDAGVLAGGAALQPPETAVTLRMRDGKRIVEDGPYADTKEQLGGIIVLEVPDLVAAVEWMWRFPGVKTGVVELRPNLPPLVPAEALATAGLAKAG